MSENQEYDIRAVEMMRSIRDELSQKMMHMSHEEQDRFIEEELQREESLEAPVPREHSA